MAQRFLLENVSTDTDGDGVFGDGAGVTVLAWGNFGGGNVTLEVSDDAGVNYVPVTENGGNDLTFSSGTSRFLTKLPMTQKLRARLIGSTTASGVNVTITS